MDDGTVQVLPLLCLRLLAGMTRALYIVPQVPQTPEAASRGDTGSIRCPPGPTDP